MLSQYIDFIIMFLVGVYASLVGFGVIGLPSLGDKARLFRVLGPMLMIIALALAAAEVFKP
jgi:hypothetical protein